MKMNLNCVVLHTFILIVSSSLEAMASSSVKDNKRILSRASEALEISSLRKIWKKRKRN